MEDWKRIVEPYARPLLFARSRLTRSKTLGVRGMCIDNNKRVLLVEHTYLEGWWLPGGGVDAMETAGEAVVRELHEEAGVLAREAPKLISIHANEHFFPGDHVLLYRIDAFEMGEMTSRGEIKNVDFFDVDKLPANINLGAQRRIEEVLYGYPPDPLW